MQFSYSEVTDKNILSWIKLLDNSVDVDSLFYTAYDRDRHFALFAKNPANGEHILSLRMNPYSVEVYAKNHYTRAFIGTVRIAPDRADAYITSGIIADTVKYAVQEHDNYLAAKQLYVRTLKGMK